MSTEKIECEICKKSITKPRWNQHLNSKSHQELAQKQTRPPTPDVLPELSGEEDNVLDDTSTETETDSSYTSGSDISD